MLSIERAISIFPHSSPLGIGDLYGRLTATGKKHLDKAVRVSEFDAGDIVYERNSAADKVWIMISGRANLLYPYKDGHAARAIRPGDACGLTETLAQLPYMATLKSLSPSSFRSINRADLIKILREEPEYREAFLVALARNYLDAYKKLSSAINLLVQCDTNHISAKVDDVN